MENQNPTSLGASKNETEQKNLTQKSGLILGVSQEQASRTTPVFTESEEVVVPRPKRINKSKKILALVILLVLFFGGVYAWFFYFNIMPGKSGKNSEQNKFTSSQLEPKNKPVKTEINFSVMRTVYATPGFSPETVKNQIEITREKLPEIFLKLVDNLEKIGFKYLSFKQGSYGTDGKDVYVLQAQSSGIASANLFAINGNIRRANSEDWQNPKGGYDPDQKLAISEVLSKDGKNIAQFEITTQNGSGSLIDIYIFVK